MTRRSCTFALALALLAPGSTAFAAQDDAAKHPIKTLEKIVAQCEADRDKKEADKLAEAQAQCSADLNQFFRNNPPADLPDELKISLQDLLISGYVSIAPEQFGWDIKKNEGTGG